MRGNTEIEVASLVDTPYFWVKSCSEYFYSGTETDTLIRLNTRHAKLGTYRNYVDWVIMLRDRKYAAGLGQV